MKIFLLEYFLIGIILTWKKPDLWYNNMMVEGVQNSLVPLLIITNTFWGM